MPSNMLSIVKVKKPLPSSVQKELEVWIYCVMSLETCTELLEPTQKEETHNTPCRARMVESTQPQGSRRSGFSKVL